ERLQAAGEPGTADIVAESAPARLHHHFVIVRDHSLRTGAGPSGDRLRQQGSVKPQHRSHAVGVADAQPLSQPVARNPDRLVARVSDWRRPAPAYPDKAARGERWLQ